MDTSIHLSSPYGLRFPGPTVKSREKVEALLKQDYDDHHVFYTTGGFHNHVSHHILAAFSIGASPERLQAIYDDHARYQRAKLPSKGLNLTSKNFHEFVGDDETNYTDLLEFFTQEIKKNGRAKVVEEYAFHPDMVYRVIAGAYHPLIVIGYAMEFGSDLLAAEGLAQAGVHHGRLAPMYDKKGNFKYDGDPGITSALNALHLSSSQKKSVLQIFQEVQADKEIEKTLPQPSQSEKIYKVIENGVLPHIIKYASMWELQESEQDVKERLKELYQACIMAYAMSPRPGRKIKFDFFLMHAVTSILMLQAWLPSMSLFHQTQLLRSHLAMTLAWYCSRGRPALHPVVLDRYQTKLKTNTANPWAHVIDATIQHEEVHVCKIIRSIVQADALWGSEPLQFPGYGVIHEPYLHAAEMTLETIRNGEDPWDKVAIGWDEGWREDKDQAHAPTAPSEGVKA